MCGHLTHWLPGHVHSEPCSYDHSSGLTLVWGAIQGHSYFSEHLCLVPKNTASQQVTSPGLGTMQGLNLLVTLLGSQTQTSGTSQ